MDFIIENALKQDNKQDEIELGMQTQARMKVIGCGGGGCNMIDWLYKKGVRGAEVIAVNTDSQHLNLVEADKKILIGKELTKGRGAGGDPKTGENAAVESKNEVKEVLRDCDMLFICAGEGGGTGSGAAPVIAEIAKEVGSIVIGVVTMPFTVERTRIDKAEDSLQRLRRFCNSVVVIDNNRLVKLVGALPMKQAFAVANELVATMIKSIVETIAVVSLVNLDFADVKAIMKAGKVCSIGFGESESQGRVEEAVKRAMNNPLLEVDYKGATGMLIHLTGGPDMKLEEVTNACELITRNIDKDAMVIWGARIQDDMHGKIRIMLIATGVSSPWILGPERTENNVSAPQSIREVGNELGISIIR